VVLISGPNLANRVLSDEKPDDLGASRRLSASIASKSERSDVETSPARSVPLGLVERDESDV
jgi:hypothetical protein